MKNNVIIEKIELFKVPPKMGFLLSINTREGNYWFGVNRLWKESRYSSRLVKWNFTILIGKARHQKNIEDNMASPLSWWFYRGGPILMSCSFRNRSSHFGQKRKVFPRFPFRIYWEVCGEHKMKMLLLE